MTLFLNIHRSLVQWSRSSLVNKFLPGSHGTKPHRTRFKVHSKFTFSITMFVAWQLTWEIAPLSNGTIGYQPPWDHINIKLQKKHKVLWLAVKHLFFHFFQTTKINMCIDISSENSPRLHCTWSSWYFLANKTKKHNVTVYLYTVA